MVRGRVSDPLRFSVEIERSENPKKVLFRGELSSVTPRHQYVHTWPGDQTWDLFVGSDVHYEFTRQGIDSLEPDQ